MQTEPQMGGHEHKYEWINCEDCIGKGTDTYGNACHGCNGRGKNARCAQCYAEFQIWQTIVLSTEQASETASAKEQGIVKGISTVPVKLEMYQ